VLQLPNSTKTQKKLGTKRALIPLSAARSFGRAGSSLVREETLLVNLCERKILFWLEIYDRLRPSEQAEGYSVVPLGIKH